VALNTTYGPRRISPAVWPASIGNTFCIPTGREKAAPSGSRDPRTILIKWIERCQIPVCLIARDKADARRPG